MRSVLCKDTAAKFEFELVGAYAGGGAGTAASSDLYGISVWAAFD